ncbi:unnamed protein product, partial [Candidula unifasciata]
MSQNGLPESNTPDTEMSQPVPTENTPADDVKDETEVKAELLKGNIEDKNSQSQKLQPGE